MLFWSVELDICTVDGDVRIYDERPERFETLEEAKAAAEKMRYICYDNICAELTEDEFFIVTVMEYSIDDEGYIDPKGDVYILDMDGSVQFDWYTEHTAAKPLDYQDEVALESAWRDYADTYNLPTPANQEDIEDFVNGYMPDADHDGMWSAVLSILDFEEQAAADGERFASVREARALTCDEIDQLYRLWSKFCEQNGIKYTADGDDIDRFISICYSDADEETMKSVYYELLDVEGIVGHNWDERLYEWYRSRGVVASTPRKR